MFRFIRVILTAAALLSLTLFAGVSCLRAGNFGDRATPPPPGFYAAMSASGIAMLVAALVGIVVLFTRWPRARARGVLLLSTFALLFFLPLLVPPPADLSP